jgi:hypothetical protein
MDYPFNHHKTPIKTYPFDISSKKHNTLFYIDNFIIITGILVFMKLILLYYVHDLYKSQRERDPKGVSVERLGAIRLAMLILFVVECIVVCSAYY